MSRVDPAGTVRASESVEAVGRHPGDELVEQLKPNASRQRLIFMKGDLECLSKQWYLP